MNSDSLSHGKPNHAINLKSLLIYNFLHQGHVSLAKAPSLSDTTVVTVSFLVTPTAFISQIFTLFSFSQKRQSGVFILGLISTVWWLEA